MSDHPAPFHRRPLRERLALARASGRVGLALPLAAVACVLLAVFARGFAWVGGVFAGVILLWRGTTGLRRAAAVKTWPVREGTVLESGIGEFARAGRVSWTIHYHPRARFEYDSPAGRMRSDRFTIAPRDWASLEPADARRLLEPYPAGARVGVRVSPDDPEVAVLHAQVSPRRRSEDAALVVGGLLVAAISLLFAAV